MQMEITIPSIISLMTLIIGYISKYLGLDSKYIKIFINLLEYIQKI